MDRLGQINLLAVIHVLSDVFINLYPALPLNKSTTVKTAALIINLTSSLKYNTIIM